MNEKKKQVMVYGIGTALLVAIAFLVLSGGGGNTVSSYSASALTTEENNFSFGDVPIGGGNVTHDFTAHNGGEEPVVVEKVFTSCMCTSARITDASGKSYGDFGMPGHGIPLDTKIEVMPGESVLVTAIYDPAAHGPSGIGFADRSIYLETNSSKSPKLEFTFQATVTP